jgi:hypothetical protein
MTLRVRSRDGPFDSPSTPLLWLTGSRKTTPPSSTDKKTTSDSVRFVLLRSNDIPATNPLGLSFRFGLQDTKQRIFPGVRRPDGMIAFEFTLKVKPGPDPDKPAFTGLFASGPADDRFVYLSWFATERGHYINRVKARLSTIDWKLVRESQKRDKPITADMSGRGPGDTGKLVDWHLE